VFYEAVVKYYLIADLSNSLSFRILMCACLRLAQRYQKVRQVILLIEVTTKLYKLARFLSPSNSTSLELVFMFLSGRILS